MNNSLFSRWLSHPTYFLFWLAVGFYSWSFTLNSKNYEPAGEKIEFSSMAEKFNKVETEEEILATEFDELQAKSDHQLLEELEEVSENYDMSKVTDPYAVDPQMVSEYDERLAELPYSTANNFFSYEHISDNEIKFQFEEPSKCAPAKLHYEKLISSNPKLKSWIQLPETESPALPLRCITHIMNSVTLPKKNYAICTKPSGAGRRGAEKSCTTPKMVSLTYNMYVDVTDCFNLNPKDLLPKISNESGFALNAYGGMGDGGIGQLTGIAIEEVNKVYDTYMTQVLKAAANKPSCARISKDKSLLTKASHSSADRCSLMAAPENPLKNLIYMAILNRMNMDRISGISYLAGTDYLAKDGDWIPVKHNSTDEFGGVFKKYQLKEKLEKLGIRNANLHFFKDALTFAGYNMGTPTSIRLFDEYLSKRLGLKKGGQKSNLGSPYQFDENEDYPKAIKTSLKDFDFHNTAVGRDVDGKEKSVVTIARMQVASFAIGKNDKPEVKLQKVKRRKELPRQWAMAHLKTFPEYLAYRANSYDGTSKGRYTMHGTPGYLNLVAEKNKSMRNLFNGAGTSPDYCSNPNFLKIKN